MNRAVTSVDDQQVRVPAARAARARAARAAILLLAHGAIVAHAQPVHVQVAALLQWEVDVRRVLDSTKVVAALPPSANVRDAHVARGDEARQTMRDASLAKLMELGAEGHGCQSILPSSGAPPRRVIWVLRAARETPRGRHGRGRRRPPARHSYDQLCRARALHRPDEAGRLGGGASAAGSGDAHRQCERPVCARLGRPVARHAWGGAEIVRGRACIRCHRDQPDGGAPGLRWLVSMRAHAPYDYAVRSGIPATHTAPFR